jgi:predicted nucleotidyltransferase
MCADSISVSIFPPKHLCADDYHPPMSLIHAPATTALDLDLLEGDIVDALLAAVPGVLALYAFGSQVRGDATPASDLDLAVLVTGYADPAILWDTSAQLALRLNCAVDLLDLRAASTVMQYQVLIHGQRLWADALPADLFECFVRSEKLNLDERRAGLVDDIQRRGRVYG